MDRSHQFRDGYRNAAKEAITWLHSRAKEMNDPSAIAALNVAAHDLGVQFRDRSGPTEEKQV